MARVVVVPLLVLAMLGGGCGQDPQAAYCAELEANREQLGTILARGSPDALVRALPVLAQLAEVAPEDISDEWQTALAAVRGFAEALEASGVDPVEYDPDDPPEQLGTEEQQRLEAAASRLVAPSTVDAFGGLEQHALDVCGLPLG